MLYNLIEIALSFTVLFFASHFLIKGAVNIAKALRISPLIIGITIIGFGTAVPEIFVSLNAAAAGNFDIAIGNIIGSNILNILMIIGIASAIAPIALGKVQDDAKSEYFAVGFMILMTVFAFTSSSISKTEGATLLVIFLFFVVQSIRAARKEMEEAEQAQHRDHVNVKVLSMSIFYCVASLTALKYGAHFLLEASVSLARAANVSDAVISTTVVAFGTAFPEHITAIMAAVKKESDIAIGNVLGSNIFNVGCVVGLCGMYNPPVAQKFLILDLPVMLASSIIFFVILKKCKKISRTIGLLFIISYMAYSKVQIGMAM